MSEREEQVRQWRKHKHRGGLLPESCPNHVSCGTCGGIGAVADESVWCGLVVHVCGDCSGMGYVQPRLGVVEVFFDYGTFPVWFTSAPGGLRGTEFPFSREEFAEAETMFWNLEDLYEAQFINNEIEFSYRGFPDAKSEAAFKDLYRQAVDALDDLCKGRYFLLADEL